MLDRLEDVQSIQIAARDVSDTLKILRKFGTHGCEGLLLWVGYVRGIYAEVAELVVPPQQPVRSEDGVGYFVEAETLFAVNRFLNEKRYRLIAQVHSHPSEAYHSDADDRYAIVTTEGGLSLVVPNFGQAAPDPSTWAVYRLQFGAWRQVRPIAVRNLFLIV